MVYLQQQLDASEYLKSVYMNAGSMACSTFFTSAAHNTHKTIKVLCIGDNQSTCIGAQCDTTFMVWL
jgi:hypothetical protein